MVSYAKLKSGDWGLRVKDEDVEVGDTVDVTTKAGEIKQEVVGRLIFRGEDFALYAKGNANGGGQAPARQPSRSSPDRW